MEMQRIVETAGGGAGGRGGGEGGPDGVEHQHVRGHRLRLGAAHELLASPFRDGEPGGRRRMDV